jgi:DNA-binding MarR family transcriptional regulator
MTDQTKPVAHQVLDIVPLAMHSLATMMRQTDLTLAPAHFRLLGMLANGPHNLSELAEKQAVSLPTMSSTVSTLADRGWVLRERQPGDRRMVVIELSPQGRDVLKVIRDRTEARLEDLLAPLSPAECEQLSAGLVLLRSIFSQAAWEGNCTPQVNHPSE